MTLKSAFEGQRTTFKMAVETVGPWRIFMYLIWIVVLPIVSANTEQPRELCDMFKASHCLRRAASMLNSQTADGGRNIELICGRNRPIDNHISICRDFVSECPRTNKNARQVRRVAKGLHLSLKSYMVHFCESTELPRDLCGDLERRTSEIKGCWQGIDPVAINCSSLQKIFYCFEDARGACNDVQIVDEENALIHESVMSLKDKKCILTFQGDVFKTPPDGEHPVRHRHGHDHTRHHSTSTVMTSPTPAPESTTPPSLLIIAKDEDAPLEEKFNDETRNGQENTTETSTLPTTTIPTTLTTTQTPVTSTTTNMLHPLPDEDDEFESVEVPPCNNPIERIFKLQECSRYSNYKQGVCRKIQRKLNCIAHQVRRCKDDFVIENADIIVNSTRFTATQFGCDVTYMGKPLVANLDTTNSLDDLRGPPAPRRSTTPPAVTKPPGGIDPNYQSTTTYYYIYEGGEDDGQYDHVYSDKNDEKTKDKSPSSGETSIRITHGDIDREYPDESTFDMHEHEIDRHNQNSDSDTESENSHVSHTDNGIKERQSENGDTIDSISSDDSHNREISLNENEEEDTNMLESRDRQEPIKSKPASSGAPSTKGVAVFTIIYLLWIYF